MGKIGCWLSRVFIRQGEHWAQNPTGKPLLLSLLPHSRSHCHLRIDSPGILNQKLLLPSEGISHHILPCHCPGLPSRQLYSFGAFTHSNSSLPALSWSILCLWGRHNAGGRRVRHGDPGVHCRIWLWILHREQPSVPASPGCLCHLQPCPASWPGSMGTAQAKPML